jgi:molybdopterin molybdotransferase
MISVEEARNKILDSVGVLGADEKPILSCLGQVLADDLVAGFDIPRADNSAMDGFAVRAVNTAQASPENPACLRVVGEVQAGHKSDARVEDGLAVRIMTGAPIPGGADAIVPFEETDQTVRTGVGDSGKVGICRSARPGQNIRRRGEDMRAGRSILKKGTVLGPAEIGVVAAMGCACVNAVRRPLVAVLPTGDELQDVGSVLPEGKIYSSNTYALAASILKCGGVPLILDIARDSMDALDTQITRAMEADMLITSGGVSMGDYDVVKDVMAARGELVFWRVRMKPGKPLAFGLLDRASGVAGKLPHLALPGNPVSSLVTFEVYARPAILKMMGRNDIARPMVLATLDHDISNGDGRRVFARVRVSGAGPDLMASLTGPQGSGILTSMAGANGLAIVPENCAVAKAGSLIQVMLLEGSACPE